MKNTKTQSERGSMTFSPLGKFGYSPTHVYLKPTAALLDQVNTRFHSHYLQNVKPEGERP